METFDLANNKNEICVILFSGSSQENHLADLLISFFDFKDYGVSPHNINVFVPNSSLSQLQEYMPEATFFDCLDYSNLVPTLAGKYLINIVTGHGNVYGIQNGSSSSISPTEYLAPIKKSKNFELAILVFGQCIAGVFNFLDARATKPIFCFIGATGLHSSLNYEVNPQITSNVFLSYFTNWFSESQKRQDVTGDGVTDLLDCFKFAGSETSQLILKSRAKWYSQMRAHEGKLLGGNLTPLEESAAHTNVEELLKLIHSVQEPWILNSNQFRSVLL